MSPRGVTIIGVGNLIEVIWPVLRVNIGGAEVSDRFIGVTADADDIERKAAHFGFEMVLHDNLGALRRNAPDLILFAPPPALAEELIASVLRPYYAELRADSKPLPELYAFPPVPGGSAYLDALGDDVLVVNIIPNNVTTIGGVAVQDEGYYVCTFPSDWPEDRVKALRAAFDGQGAYVRLEPHQLIPMLGAAATVSALWMAVPELADHVGVHHNVAGAFMRACLDPDAEEPHVPAQPELLAVAIRSWYRGVERYHAETDIDPAQAKILRERSFDLTLHTIAEDPREVLIGHSVGAATKGGVLEKALDSTREVLLPAIESVPDDGPTETWAGHFADLVTRTCHVVREHGATLAD